MAALGGTLATIKPLLLSTVDAARYEAASIKAG